MADAITGNALSHLYETSPGSVAEVVQADFRERVRRAVDANVDRLSKLLSAEDRRSQGELFEPSTLWTFLREQRVVDSIASTGSFISDLVLLRMSGLVNALERSRSDGLNLQDALSGLLDNRRLLGVGDLSRALAAALDAKRSASIQLDVQLTINRGHMRLPRGFATTLLKIAREAWQTTLWSIMEITKPADDDAVQDILNDTSFRDGQLAIAFVKNNGELSITRDQPGEQIDFARRRLEEAITSIEDKNGVERLSNSAPNFGSLFAAYKGKMTLPGGPIVEDLWFTGYSIQQEIGFAATNSSDPEFPPIPRDLLGPLDTFIVAHNLFVGQFARIHRITAELEAQRATLRPFIERRESPHHEIMVVLADTRGVFDTSSSGVMQAAVGARTAPGADEASGSIAAKVSISRGALQAMTSVALAALGLLAGEAVKGVIGNAASDIAKDVGLHQAVLEFFHASQPTLIKIAHQAPALYGWLDNLVRLVLHHRSQQSLGASHKP